MRKLLIAVAEPVFIDELTKAFRQHWEVCVCTDGYAAVERIRSLHPEALIIDLQLPKKDGLSVLVESFLDLPPTVVALSAVISPRIRQDAARWGVDYLFEIPFDLDKVKMALDEAVGQQIPAKRTAQHLRALGARAGLDGYSCVITAVPYLIEDPARKLGKEVYTYVSKVCGLTDYRNVERAIRFMINNAWHRRDVEIWARYFPLNAKGDIDRPKSKDFIRCLMLLCK